MSPDELLLSNFAIMDDKSDIHSSGESPSGQYYSERSSGGLFNRVVDSFKRDPSQHATPKGALGADGKVFDVENAAIATAESPLARKLKGRHLQMIAIGGSIGMTSLALPVVGRAVD
jgi:amino acid transporter